MRLASVALALILLTAPVAAQIEDPAVTAMLTRYVEASQAFSRSNPDYPRAYQFLIDAWDAELRLSGVTDTAERQNRLLYQEGLAAGQAIKSGYDPARSLYADAIRRGYNPQAPSRKPSALDHIFAGLLGFDVDRDGQWQARRYPAGSAPAPFGPQLRCDTRVSRFTGDSTTICQ